MRLRPSLLAALAAVLASAVFVLVSSPKAARSQQPADVLLNVIASGAKKLSIAVPDFTLVGGADPQVLAKRTPEVVSNDLNYSALFSVLAGGRALPANNPGAQREAWSKFAAEGAHAALLGLLTTRGDRVEVEMRLFDLTSSEQRLIASKKFEMSAAQSRRLAHKIADEVVLQFTGESGVADTKIAYTAAAPGGKEIYMMDYDGVGVVRMTTTQTINLTPVWSPDTRSIAFTSYMHGYPFLYRLFPFEKRPMQLLAGYGGINSSPAWSPDGKSVALTLSKDGNPEVYLLNVTTGALRRLTNNPAIDTEPSWSPTGREIAFVSDRMGPAQIFVMDAEGTNVRQLSIEGFNTQPRWSPKGDLIVYTSRQGNFDLWAINPDGSNLRRLTAGPGSNQGASWSPDGRHLVFQSNRVGTFQLVTMLADGSEQVLLTKGPTETTSGAWSPRLP
jgi:TolB protein